jgi:hypothetical protein
MRLGRYKSDVQKLLARREQLPPVQGDTAVEKIACWVLIEITLVMPRLLSHQASCWSACKAVRTWCAAMK